MKKLAMVATLAAAAAVAVPAHASKPENPGSQRAEQAKSKQQDSARRGSSRTEGTKSKSKGRCAPRPAAYVAFGDYVSGALTQTQGADTADTARDDRWSGELVVAVKRTNKHGRADKGATKTYTLTDAKLRLADRNDDGTADPPIAGDRTRIQGKITRLNRGCNAAEGLTAELRIRSVGFHRPKSVETPAPTPAPAP